MDQKKTLWIIAAVGAFLLVVLVPAFIMFPKAPQYEQTITRNLPEQKKTPVNTDDGWNPPAPVPNELAVNDLTVFAENANVYGFDTSDSSTGTTIDLNALRAETAAATAPAPSQDINITVEIKEPEVKAVPASTSADYYVAKPEDKPVVQKVTKVENKSTSTEKASAPVKTTTKSTSTSSVKVTATTKAPATKTQYWVQVAAYSSKKGAEGARAVLDANKITADIFTYKDAKDNLFYRVRVGPYTTKSEAEYWRSKIIKISEFSKAESYITSTNTEL